MAVGFGALGAESLRERLAEPRHTTGGNEDAPGEQAMRRPIFDVTPFLHQDEGQHFDRKSLFEGPAGPKRPRGRRDLLAKAADALPVVSVSR